MAARFSFDEPQVKQALISDKTDFDPSAEMTETPRYSPRDDPEQHHFANGTPPASRSPPLNLPTLEAGMTKAKRPVNKRARNALLLATGFTMIFMVVEIVGGYIADSLAIMTDAAHLLTDVAAMCLSLFAMALSSRPATDTMTFGFHRAEILGALASVVTIWALVGVLVYEAILRLIADSELAGDVVDGRIMTIIGVAGLLVNLIDAAILHWGGAPHGHSHGGGGHAHGHDHSDEGKEKKKKKEKEEGHGHSHGGHSHGHAGKEEKKEKKKKKDKLPHAHANVNVRAAFIHVLGDCLQSLGVIAAAVIVWVGNVTEFGKPAASSMWNLADPIASLLFGVITLITTLKLLRNIVDVLMERVPEEINVCELKQELASIMGVLRVHDLHVWALTMGKISLSVHLSAEDHVGTLLEAQRICRDHGITHTTIQIDPPDVACEHEHQHELH